MFFALWPDDAVRNALARVAQAAQRECGGRTVPEDKVHVTLFFVGNVQRSRMPELEALAGGIEARRFELVVDLLDYWRHNHIVWAGMKACPDPLARLASALTAALDALGFPAEDRPYLPHVTLVRNAKRAPRSMSVAPVRWSVSEFALIESVPLAAGARYDLVARWPLLV